MTLWDEFVDAYLDNNIEHRWFLDLEQGIVVIDWDEAATDWDDPRYVSIPQCTSSEAYSWRERFAAQDSSGRLEDALTRNRPFRYFKGLFAIYGWMVFCFISTELACFVQNVVDWAVGIILCFVQNTVELLPGV